jgi:SAM-dependent methyltransferase
MRSRFAERIYFKPKGYAGDFMMMEMIYRNQWEGDGKVGKIIDGWCLDSIGANAIRGRRKLLYKELHFLCNKIIDQDSINIMNLACGPNRELFDFLADFEATEKIEATCIDIDADALQYTDKHVNTFSHNANIRLMTENLVKWALGRTQHDFSKQDIIYSAGLTDYLEPKLFVRLIDRCYQQLKPGGNFILGNFAPNPDRIFMDHILQWRLIYRTARELKEVFADSLFGDRIEIIAEEQKVNLFVKATREA